jgi:hypothetical protein
MAEHQFEGPIKGYLVNQMQRGKWRVAATMTEDDIMQDGYEVFARCARRYPDVEPQHFMALFKTAWYRHMCDVSLLDTEARRIVSTHGGHNFYGSSFELNKPLDTVGDLDNDGYVQTLVRQAPSEVKQVLTLLLNAPSELLELAMSSWRRNGKNDAGGNKQVSQWLGLPVGSKPLDAVRDYFEI